jgi:flagellar hook assembly protein FlgD
MRQSRRPVARSSLFVAAFLALFAFRPSIAGAAPTQAPQPGVTGSIDLSVEPDDAAVLVDGTAARPGLSELPVGRHRLQVRRFGYAEKSLDFEVREKNTTRLSVALGKAPFAIQGFGFSRKTFNPNVAGAIASTDLAFRAASRGSARAEIRNSEGRVVASFEFPDIEDWSQSRKWDGLGSDGRPLPDGIYSARLVAKGEGPGTPIEAEAQVFIDSDLIDVLPADTVPTETKSVPIPVPLGSQPPQINPPDGRIQTLKVENTLKKKIGSIQIYCTSRSARNWSDDTPSARIYIDRDEIDWNWVPYLGDLEEGSHYIEVRMPGYYPLGHWFMLAEKTLYTIQFSPTRITGSIDLDVEPKDSAVILDGAAAKPGLSELPVGGHRLEVRRFGYVERDLHVEVQEKETAKLRVALEKAPFAIQGFGFARNMFNPRSAGALSATTLEFRATGPGSARVEIRGPDDQAVASFDFPDIEDWSQSRSWDGLGSDGQPLPEGRYTARLVAKAAGSEETIDAEAQAWIDPSLVVRPSGVASATPGLLFMPDPVPSATGASSVEVFYFVPPKSSWSSSGESAFGIAGAFSVANGIELGLHAAAELGTEAASAGDLDGSVLLALMGDKTTAWSGAFFFRGGYSSIGVPAMPASGSLVEAALPLGARLGSVSEEADARFAFAPGLRADFSTTTTWIATCRSALWLEGRKFRAGVSGELPLDFSGGRASIFRWVDAALEGRLMLGGFDLAGYATAEFPPGETPAFGLGLGLGLLF